MLQKALSLLVLVGLSLPVNVSHACVVWDSEAIDDPTTVAYKNLEVIRDYLVQVGELELGGWVGDLLKRGKIYKSEELDHWFAGKLQGCTTLPLNVTLRSDFLEKAGLMSFSLTATDDQFRAASDLLRLVIHEFIHVIDLNQTGISLEQDTYERSFVVLSAILKKHLLDQAETFATSNPARAAQYQNQAAIFAAVLAHEVATYDTDEYAEITGSFYPLLDHQGCVRTMTRAEYPTYLNILASSGSIPTWKDYVAKVDSMAKSHLPPAVSGNCSKPMKIAAPTPDQAWTVGHQSARHRFKVYEVDVRQSGHFLRMTKKGPAADLHKLELTAYESDVSDPRKLKKIGSIASHWTTMRYQINGYGQGIKIFVEENNPGAFPGTVSIEAFEEWTGADGAQYQAPLTLTEVSVGRVGTMGYYPAAALEKDVKLNFFSRVFFDDARDQMVALEVELKKGDLVNTHLSLPPATEPDQRREGRWYRVTSPSTAPISGPLALESVMLRNESQREFPVYQDGRYIFVVRRLGRSKTLAHYSVRFDVSHNGQRAHNPAFIQVTELAPDQYYKIQSTLPLEFEVDGVLDAASSYVGYRKWFSPGTLAGEDAFKPFHAYQLNTQEKDVVRFSRFAMAETETPECYIAEGASLQPVFSYTMNCNEFEFVVPSNKDYYWVVVGSSTPGLSQKYTVQIQMNRISTQPTWGWEPQQVQDAAFFKALQVGLRTEVRLEKQKITPLHPKGFLRTESRYLAYRIQTSADSSFAMSHPYIGISRNVYLTEFDAARWAAGQPALKDLYNGTQSSWTHHRKLPAGDYILVIEGGYQIDQGDVPALLRFTGVDVQVTISEVSYTDLTNPGFKLFY